MTEQPQPGMLAPARHAQVLDALARDGTVRISDLVDQLGVTAVTLRRDFVQLEAQGQLVRVHGGAIAARPDEHGPASGAAGDAATNEIQDARPQATDIGSPPTVGSIAVLVPSLSFYWPTVVRGMEARAQHHGVKLILRGASYELQDERPVLERLVRSSDVRGLIVAPNPDTEHAEDVVCWLTEAPIPSILVEREAFILPERVPLESVHTDHALGAMLAVHHLAELGHERVGLVLSRNSPTSRKIVKGWQIACTDLGLSPSPHFEDLFPNRGQPGFAAVVNATLDKVLERGVTGLLVHSDPEAMAVIDLALTRQISVPGDLSIIAYDDEVAELFTPALTAVSPPREAVGETAVDLLLARIADPSRPVRRVELNPTLIVRESTAPPA